MRECTALPMTKHGTERAILLNILVWKLLADTKGILLWYASENGAPPGACACAINSAAG